jgi:hypothetical protein
MLVNNPATMNPPSRIKNLVYGLVIFAAKFRIHGKQFCGRTEVARDDT